MIDMGPIPWAEPALKAKVSPKDPLFERLVKLAKAQPCAEVTAARVQGDKLPFEVYEGAKVDLSVKAALDKLFKENRGFECQRAGERLQPLQAGRLGPAVIYVRGHRRVMIAVAGWSSICVDAHKADAMSDKALLKLWTQVTARYVQDRHDNP